MSEVAAPSPTAPVVSDDIIKALEEYGKAIAKFKFDKARELLETFRAKRAVPPNVPLENTWNCLITQLIQIAISDKNYFQLTFLSPSLFRFRKGPALQVQYIQIAEELRRVGRQVIKDTLSYHLISHCREYALARKATIQLYVDLSECFFVGSRAKNDDELEEIMEKVETCHAKWNNFHHPILAPLTRLYVEEMDTVRALFNINKLLITGRMSAALLKLKETRERIEFWMKDAAMNITVQRSVFSFFRGSANKNNVRNRLVQWMVFFHQHLLAKFTLYFSDNLGPYCNATDFGNSTKMVNNPPESPNYLAFCREMKNKRSDISMIFIVLNRMSFDDDEPFFGIGYHHEQSMAFNHCAIPEPLSGIIEKYPILFRYPSNWELNTNPQPNTKNADTYHAEIASFIQSCCSKPMPEKEVFYDSKIDKVLIYGHLEDHICAVIVLESNKTIKNGTDPQISQFIRELSSLLRGQQLFNTLKTYAR